MKTKTDESRVGEPRRVFPSSFGVYFLTHGVLAQLLAAAVGAALWVTHGGTAAVQVYPAMALAALIGSGINAYYSWRESGPAVGPNGIVALGPRGKRTFVAWPAVHTVGVKTVLGAAHVRLGADGIPGPVWVPLSLSDLVGFTDAVREHAGGDHPLTRALDEWDALGAGE